MRMLLLLPLIILFSSATTRKTEIAAPNNNITPAGTLENGTLRLELEVRAVAWHPENNGSRGYEVLAFAERGKVAQIPGPLIRVPAHTSVQVTVRNPLKDSPLKIVGLHARPLHGAASSLIVPPGETRTTTFMLDTPGTYFYWGTTADSAMNRRVMKDSQLSGAIVVDDALSAKRGERIFVITQAVDSINAVAGPAIGSRQISAINGRSWPHTERFTQDIGDTVRWRWINASNAAHPMHLHGFYFIVEGKGHIAHDSIYDSAAQRRAVTERVTQGATMRMRWTPERAGNWLFHCHVPSHIEPQFGSSEMVAMKARGHHMNHATEGMAGLILGIHVSGPDGTDADSAIPRRALRMVAEPDTNDTPAWPAFRFSLDQPDALARSGLGITMNPVLVVRKNEPVSIRVVNHLGHPTAVHWHGIELESYFDGVAGFGGYGKRISPVIEPGDSFAVRFTPPRAGTFMYHTHVDEPLQEVAGLSGALIVIEPNATFDARSDHIVLLSTPRRREARRVYINNSLTPAPLEMRAGEEQRLRILNITVTPPIGADVTLMKGSTVLAWRPLAKDGADLPAHQATPQKSSVRISMGETYDFAVTLREPGDYRIEVRGAGSQRPLVGTLPIHVRSAN